MTFANLSGGRDSTAMIVKWLEDGRELDYIVFCDMGFEFEAMYEYLDKLENFLLKNFNKRITRLDCRGIFERWAFEYPIARGEKQGRLRGLPREVGMSFCTREGKAVPTKKFIKSVSTLQPFKNTVLIGYTAREVKNGRSTSLDYATVEYPLANWGWNEPECEAFLSERGIANPLYRHFKRTGCYFCPHQNKESLFNLWKFYPKEWKKSKEFEAVAKSLDCENQTFKIQKSFEDFEKEFQTSPTMEFEASESDEKYCFCR